MASKSSKDKSAKVVNTDLSREGREKALEEALKLIEKQFGKGSIMKLGDDSKITIETIPTGSLSLDVATGVGGIPRGRITEIYGPERRHWRFTLLQKHRNWAVRLHL